MEEQRILKRRHLIYYLRVFDVKNDTLLGHVVDLTPEGLMIISDKGIKKNSKFKLKMGLSEEFSGKKELIFDAQCLWNKKDINPDFYDAGFKLTKIAEEDKDIIEELIETFGFND